jgi:hypothetical protein
MGNLGCTGENRVDFFDCMHPIETRKDTLGRPDPCCDLEPECRQVGTTCSCKAPCGKDATRYYRMDCKLNATDITCDCFEQGVLLGSCQELAGQVCVINEDLDPDGGRVSCCNVYF